MRINTVRQRIVVGVLGMLLPWIVAALVGYIPDSISATWHTNACTVFMIILGWASGTLVCYKGYELIDDVLLTCAGIAGFGICLFPCTVSGCPEKFGTFLIDSQVSNTLHCVFAVIFFGLLAYNSLFLFTKGSGEPDARKKVRNIIFRVCGIGMVASFTLILLPVPCKMWITEAIALSFFGISFLTKANVIPFLFCDKKVHKSYHQELIM